MIDSLNAEVLKMIDNFNTLNITSNEDIEAEMQRAHLEGEALSEKGMNEGDITPYEKTIADIADYVAWLKDKLVESGFIKEDDSSSDNSSANE